MNNLLIKLPTRNRPEKLKKQMDLYRRFLLRRGTNIRFLLSLDTDDATMNTPEIRDWLDSQPDLEYYYGNSKTKIEACNADIDRTDFNWDVMMLLSDDMIPKRKGYDRWILDAMQDYFPDTDGVLHYNDGKQGPRLNTLPILGRKYYDRFGYVYHPDYKSVYADNEFTIVSRNLGKDVYFDIVLFHHEWIDGGVDDLYIRNESPELYEHDYNVLVRHFIRGGDRGSNWNSSLPPTRIGSGSESIRNVRANLLAEASSPVQKSPVPPETKDTIGTQNDTKD